MIKRIKSLKARLRTDRIVRLAIDQGNNKHYRWTAIDVEDGRQACRSVGWRFDTVEDAVNHAKNYMDVEGE